jgi:hypothetical protein
MEILPSRPEQDNSNNQNNLNRPAPAEPAISLAGTPNNNLGTVSPKKHEAFLIIAVTIILIAACVLSLLVLGHHKKAPTQDAKASNCISQSFDIGSSGSCVTDIQSMVNFFETDNFNECAFTGAQTLDINGDFNNATKSQVMVVQKWLNCYNKQEGAPGTINANGIVGSSTWSNFCTYAYSYPKQAGQSSSPYFKDSLAAGKNAGC